VRERFEQLNSLDAGQRREVEERADRLRRMAEEVVKNLSESERARLAALDPQQRAAILRGMAEEAARQRGQRVHGKLPQEVRERLEAASPEERTSILANLRERARKHESARAIERLGHHLHLDREQVERWKALPTEQRMEKVMELGRLAIEQGIEGGSHFDQSGRQGSGEARKPGSPPGLDRETWQRIRQLPPKEFHAALQRMGHSLNGNGNGKGKGHGTPPPAWASDLSPEQLERLRRAVNEKGRHLASDWLDVAEMPEPERREELGRRSRARAIKHIEEQKLLGPEKLGLLRSMTDRQFADAVRRLMGAGGARHPRRPGAVQPGKGGADAGHRQPAPGQTGPRRPQRPKQPPPKGGAGRRDEPRGGSAKPPAPGSSATPKTERPGRE
jgi:hypothetical protein